MLFALFDTSSMHEERIDICIIGVFCLPSCVCLLVTASLSSVLPGVMYVCTEHTCYSQVSVVYTRSNTGLQAKHYIRVGVDECVFHLVVSLRNLPRAPE